jgi:ParB/RepB/Spo0J family partition protein
MTTAKTITAAKVQQIPLDLLDANPLNPRRTMHEASLAELAYSIRQTGINQPLLVRPAPVHDGESVVEVRYEIVCGHRRFRAAEMLEMETVPCIVREMTDNEAAEIALVDNLQREDVGALEEAEAFGALLGLHGTVEAVAARVGKDVAYVAKRLKLRTLGTWQRDALHGKLISVDHALLLARLGIEEQDAALKWALDRNAGSKTPVDKVIAASQKSLAEGNKNRYFGVYWEPESVKKLKQHIEETSGRKLSRAPWDLDDAQLVADAGACSVCPSNTKANTSLFGDLAIEEATCADGQCFEQKREAFVQIKLKETGATALRLSWKATSTAPRFDIVNVKPIKGTAVNSIERTPKLTQVFKAGQWIAAKKDSCLNVLAGITVDWSDAADRGYMGKSEKLRKPGEKLLVCVAEKCKAHRKEWEKPKSDIGQRSDPAIEKAAQEKRKALAIEEGKLRMAVVSVALEGITSIPAEALRALVVAAVPRYGDEQKSFEGLLPGFMKTLKTAKVESAEFAKGLAIASLDELRPNEWQGPESGRKEFLASAARIGFKGYTPWDKPKAAKKAPGKSAAKKVAKKGKKS